MGVSTLSVFGILTIIAIANVVVQEPKEPLNLTCMNDSECIDKMQACNVFCHVDNPHVQIGFGLDYNEQPGRCVEMMYVDSGKFPGCD